MARANVGKYLSTARRQEKAARAFHSLFVCFLFFFSHVFLSQKLARPLMEDSPTLITQLVAGSGSRTECLLRGYRWRAFLAGNHDSGVENNIQCGLLVSWLPLIHVLCWRRPPNFAHVALVIERIHHQMHSSSNAFIIKKRWFCM